VEEEKKPEESVPAEVVPEAPAEAAAAEAAPAETAPTEATVAEAIAGEASEAGEPAAQPSQSDCNLAALAHGSILLNLVVPGLGLVAALLIWLNVRERSRYAGFQSLQALTFQGAVLLATVLGGVLVVAGWLISGLLTVVLVGCLLMPFALLLTIAVALVPIAGLVYGLVAAYETYYGHDFRYWLVGEWLEREQAR
jgi:uncharacterized Tic20 family protein